MLITCRAVEALKDLFISQKNPSVLREAAKAISNMTSAFDSMCLWMKFDSNRLVNESSNCSHIAELGKPQLLPPGKGLYDNWGVFVNYGDVFEVSNRSALLGRQWSISVWVLIPVLNTGVFHTLIQNVHGFGGFLVIDEEGKMLGAFDELSGEFIESGVNLKKLKKGWRHIAVTCDNKNSNSITFFIDGRASSKSQYIICSEPIGYVGNSKDGQEPFGIFCDLRIFNTLLTERQVAHLAFYETDIEMGLPDKISQQMLEHGIIDLLIEKLEVEIEETLSQVCRALANIASKKECRTYIMEKGVFERVMKNVNSTHEDLSHHVCRLICNLK